jgi:hypothetical protein
MLLLRSGVCAMLADKKRWELPKDAPQRYRYLESTKRFVVYCVCLFLVSPR